MLFEGVNGTQVAVSRIQELKMLPKNEEFGVRKKHSWNQKVNLW